MLSFLDIAKIFEEIELKLIASLTRNLSRHKAWEKEEGFKWSAWQAEKLKNMERFRRENQGILGEYTDVIDRETRTLMQEEFKEGEELVNSQLEELKEEMPEATESDLVTSDNFFGVNQNKMHTLMNDITQLEKDVSSAALRMTDDIYRQTLNKVQLSMGTGSTALQKAIDSALKDFLDKGINCIEYKDGRRVNIADYVRMALRTTSTRATLQGEAKRRTELGYDTVLVSQYNACSDTCLSWQGRVYIDDVFTVWEGEIDGDRGKSNYCGKWFTLLSVAIQAGLFHPNCRHTMTTWIDGVSSKPKPLDISKVRENAKLEAKQRRLENKIRQAKRRVLGYSDPRNIKQAKSDLKEAQRELREFINEHSDVLKRDYNREKVEPREVNKTLDKQGGNDIIKAEGEDKMTIGSIEKPIETPMEQRNTGKGNPNAILTFGIDLNNRQKAILEQLPEFDSRIIIKKKSVNMADLSAFTANTGHEFALFTKGNERLIIRGNENMVDISIDDAKKLADLGYKWSGHTHPGIDFLCMQPSDGDYSILKCFKQNNAVVYNSKGDFRTFQKRSE